MHEPETSLASPFPNPFAKGFVVFFGFIWKVCKNCTHSVKLPMTDFKRQTS